ncbi:MAG: PKD domain-containing protein, partial [Thermoplasmata archaeon]|nr:PKD domain-containing protein [Thermoplasmata archaeon]
QLTSDLRSFTGAYGLSVGTVHYLYPVPTTVNLNSTSTGWGSEEALDLEWSRAMAPGANIDMTFAPDASTGLYASVDWLVAHQSVNVISLSWGEPDVGAYNVYAGGCSSACNATSDGSYALLHPVMVAAALEGIGVFAASGDCGAAFGTSGVSTSYPASDPAVVGVGATDLVLSSGAYSNERAWSGNQSGAHSPGCQNQGGSGGGYSPFPRPAWQSAPGFPTARTQRGVPDISIIGGSPGVAVVTGGFSGGVSGTSVSCPVWAGLAAIADQLHGSPLGLITPSLYAIARGGSAATYFHDVKSGSNGYSATTGWDPVTGIGTPIASKLLPLLGAGSVAPTTLFADAHANPRSGTAPLAVAFTSVTYGATSPLDGFDVDFGDGNSTWTTSGAANHTYRHTGVFLARTVAFLTDGNSSISPPVSVVVGGGALLVGLNASTTSPSAGAAVTFNATATGGTPSYRFTYTFGDGTYAAATKQASVVHAYPIAGTYCASVVAWDSAAPPFGGSSGRLPIAVGGVAAGSCHGAAVISATISASVRSTDLPGDIAFHVTPTGGAAPYSVRLVSDDPYVTACDCGIFSIAGPHTVTAFVNDSQSGSTQVSINVTLYPAIAATFTASPPVGQGTLNVQFSAVASGGNGTDANLTNWSFGDGP